MAIIASYKGQHLRSDQFTIVSPRVIKPMFLCRVGEKISLCDASIMESPMEYTIARTDGQPMVGNDPIRPGDAADITMQMKPSAPWAGGGGGPSAKFRTVSNSCWTTSANSKIYIPMQGSLNESTAMNDIQQRAVAPYDGKIIMVAMSATADPGSCECSVHVNGDMTPIASVVAVATAHAASGYRVVFDLPTAAIAPGDEVSVAINPTAKPNNARASVVWEWTP